MKEGKYTIEDYCVFELFKKDFKKICKGWNEEKKFVVLRDLFAHIEKNTPVCSCGARGYWSPPCGCCG